MQINQLNSIPKLTLSQLTNNCYYKFISLPNYIFIFSKDFPNDLIPIVNNDSELKDDYHRFKSDYKNYLYQPVEIVSIEHLSFSQNITNLENLNELFIPVYDLDTEMKKCLSFRSNLLSKDKKFFLYRNSHADCIYMFYPITLTDICYFQLLKNYASLDDRLIKNKVITESSKAIIKQIGISKIDYKLSDKSTI